MILYYILFYYLRASPPAAGPSSNQLTSDWQDWEDLQDWQDWLDRVTLGAQSSHLGGWRVHFGTLGDHLGDPGVPGDTPQDTLGSRSGFLSILGGFWDPLGTHFGVIFVTFS